MFAYIQMIYVGDTSSNRKFLHQVACMCDGRSRNVLTFGTASAPQAGCSAKSTSCKAMSSVIPTVEGAANCHKLLRRKQPNGVDWLVLEKSECGCRVERSRGRVFLLWGTCGGLSRLLLRISRYRVVPMRSKTRKLCAFCFLFRHADLYSSSCCNQ